MSTSVLFADAVRLLSTEARSLGLDVPSFRSPPRRGGLKRSVRRRPDGSSVVAIRITGRNDKDVLTDMVDGVLAVNELDDDQRDVVRAELLLSMSVLGDVA